MATRLSKIFGKASGFWIAGPILGCLNNALSMFANKMLAFKSSRNIWATSSEKGLGEFSSVFWRLWFPFIGSRYFSPMFGRFGNTLAHRTKSTTPFNRLFKMPIRMVLHGMEKFKVLNSIVHFVVVFVMKKKSFGDGAMHRFPNHPMKEGPSPLSLADFNLHIPIMIDSCCSSWFCFSHIQSIANK